MKLLGYIAIGGLILSLLAFAYCMCKIAKDADYKEYELHKKELEEKAGRVLD